MAEDDKTPRPSDESSPDQVGEWVDEHGDFLYRYALLRLRNPDEAGDVVQEAFLGALKSLGRKSPDSPVRAWLMGILKHKVIDRFRARYKERPVSEIEAPEESVEDFFDDVGEWKKGPLDWGQDPSDALEHKEFWQTFHDCVAHLPSRLADAFTLKVIEGHSSEEVNKVLNVTSTNLWVILYRARLKLRHCLEVKWFGSEAGESRK